MVSSLAKMSYWRRCGKAGAWEAVLKSDRQQCPIRIRKPNRTVHRIANGGLISLAGQFGLGVMSAENTPAPTATTDRWAFVKLDRVSPTSDAQQRAEAMDGSYSFWYELAAFTAGGAISPASASGAALIAAATSTLGESDLKGFFATPVAGSSGPTSKGARLGNSCQPAVQ